MDNGCLPSEASTSESERLDAIVVGAGLGGLYALHKLRSDGLRVRVLEQGSGVGGVWYWNRYPGARCDIPILNYSYSFSDEIRREWKWSERYAAQPEIERYANYVADKLDLRKDISFNSAVTTAQFDAETAEWVVTTEHGERVRARFCVMATGGFSEPIVPNIEGIESFEGQIYYTTQWPDKPIDISGKRVGVIGTGSSGVQTITALGKQDAFDQLYVFQRTANFAVPAPNYPLDVEYQEQFLENFPTYWQAALNSGAGAYNEGPEGPIADLSDDEFIKRMEEGYSIGGPSTLAGVSDMVTNEAANGRVADYVRARIRERVQDPKVAEILCPQGHFIGSRRVIYENGYFEVYNNPKVTLVDVHSAPIRRIYPTGIETAEQRHELDALIFATGFDSGTGALMKLDLIGRDGIRIQDKWASGPHTYLGVMMAGFPNFFVITGPGSPSIRSNVIVSIEQHVEWISDLIHHMREEGVESVEPTPQAEAAWTEHVAQIADATLLTRDDTQYMGVNVPGKPRVFLAYVGGIDVYRLICDQVARNNYEGLRFTNGQDVLCPGGSQWSGPPPTDQLPRFRNSVIEGSSVL